MEVEFNSLKGLTLISIEGLTKGSGAVLFNTLCGKRFGMVYIQDCCAEVSIEDFEGSIEDMLNTPILLAENTRSDGSPPEYCEYGTSTWTFYKLATVKGTLDIRWYGSSNGYYSEEVGFFLDDGEQEEWMSYI